MPLVGSVSDRIKELYHAPKKRKRKQIFAIALNSFRRDQRKGRQARSR